MFGVGVATLTNSTISGNRALGDGGGIHVVSDARIENSIVLGNTAGLNTEEFSGNGSFVGENIVNGHILKGNVSSIPNARDDITVADVFATTFNYNGVLADNGGPVQTIALKADLANPALDASSVDAPATDARGEGRVDQVGVGSDIIDFADLGAFELIATVEDPSLIMTTNNDVVDAFDGETSLREAVAFANSNADASVITFDVPVSSVNVNAELHISTDITIDGDLDGDDRPDITLQTSNNRFFVTDFSDTDVDFVVQSLELTGGVVSGINSEGGAILVEGPTNTLTVRDSIFADNGDAGAGGTDGGGAIHITSGELLVERSVFEENAASNSGAAISTDNSDVTIRDSFFGSNTNAEGTVSIGGGTFQIENSTFYYNLGPALFLGGDGLLANTTVAGNFFGSGVIECLQSSDHRPQFGGIIGEVFGRFRHAFNYQIAGQSTI